MVLLVLVVQVQVRVLEDGKMSGLDITELQELDVDKQTKQAEEDTCLQMVWLVLLHGVITVVEMDLI